MRKALLVLILAVGLCVQSMAEVSPIKVFVFSKSSPDGFVDSRTIDSVKDIAGNLGKRKGVAIVTNKEDADVTIEVLTSAEVVTGTNTEARRGIFGGVVATTTASTLPSINATLRVRNSEYSKDLSFTGQLFWRDLAGRIANQAIAWINTNWDQLQKTLSQDAAK